MVKGYYCSNAFLEEVKIQTKELWSVHLGNSLFFINELKEKWENESSIDGLINQAPRIIESIDKKIMVDLKFRETQIFINGIPRIRENRWTNLISKLKTCLEFPNFYLKIDSNLVKELIYLTNTPDVGILYKALTLTYDPIFFEEDTYSILQTGFYIPTQKELEDKNAIFETNHIYIL